MSRLDVDDGVMGEAHLVLLGIVELDAAQLLAIAAFVIALGLLLRFGDLRVGRRRPRDRRAQVAATRGVPGWRHAIE